MAGKTGLIGYYNEDGYRICEFKDGSTGEDIYTAGNSPYESSVTVPRERGLGLETMQKYCEQTGKEMAEEQGVEWLGCEEEDE